eukprot:Skav228818  [mRNA]  locus=scaffold359:391483:427252:+ [translate_table: standard]
MEEPALGSWAEIHQDPSRASSISTACPAPSSTELCSILRALGHRLINASRHRPMALVVTTASELRVSLPRDFTARLRVHALQLNAPMRMPIGPAALCHSAPCSSGVQLHFRCSGPMTYEDAASEVLQAPGKSASAKLAAQLLTNRALAEAPHGILGVRDLSLGRGRVGLLQRSPELWTAAWTVAPVAWKLVTTSAILRPTSDCEAFVMKHKAWPLGDRQDVFRGTVFACGVNDLGQLGTGPDLPWSGAPVRVVALKEAGVWSWGHGEGGVLGLGAPTSASRSEPTKLLLGEVAPPRRQVPGLRNIAIRLVACGTCHAVAIDLNGQAFSWGSQKFGKLGRSDAGITSRALDGCDEPGLLRSVARLRLARVACGLHHSLLVTDVTGKRSSWGTGSLEAAKLGGQWTKEESFTAVELLEKVRTRLPALESLQILASLGRSAEAARRHLGERRLGKAAAHAAEALQAMDPAEISCCLEVLLDAAHDFAANVVTVAYQQLLKVLLSLAAPKEDTMASQALRNELLGNQPFPG